MTSPSLICGAFVLALIASYVSVYLFFPELHINNAHYQIENVIFLCAAVAIVVDALLLSRYYVAGYFILAATVAAQVWTLHAGPYGSRLRDDLRKHPYYLAGLAVKERTPLDSVIVGFGMAWGADVPYFADRRGIIVDSGFPLSAVRHVLFEQRARWLGGRKLGAVVDCAVFENQRISPNLVPVRNALKEEQTGKIIEITGTFCGATVNPPHCQIFLPRE